MGGWEHAMETRLRLMSREKLKRPSSTKAVTEAGVLCPILHGHAWILVASPSELTQPEISKVK